MFTTSLSPLHRPLKLTTPSHLLLHNLRSTTLLRHLASNLTSRSCSFPPCQHHKINTLHATCDGHKSQIIVLRATEVHLQPNKSVGLPLLLMFHCVSHRVVGHPGSEIALLRLLVTAYNMIYVAPCYHLAPEHPVPASINDA